MNRNFDLEWFVDQSKDSETKEWVLKIDKWRKHVFDKNEFIKGDELFKLNFKDFSIWMREYNAFSEIEIYNEIFNCNNHTFIPEFKDETIKTIVDIGGNLGFYTMKMRSIAPDSRIFTYEPNPFNYELLKKNIETNKLKNIIIFNKAVGPEKTKLNFEFIKEIGAIGGIGLRVVEREWMKESFIENTTVDCITIKDILIENNLSIVDILKIDTEGMELDILESSLEMLPKINKIVVEFHSDELKEGLINFLTANNFDHVFTELPENPTYFGDLYFINKNFQ